MGVAPSFCQWILSYLRNRTQRVRIGSNLSTCIYTSIGAPQGCVLSPVLFTLYTDQHRGDAEHTYIIKYADDTAIIGLMNKDRNEYHYRRAIEKFVTTCDQEGLLLNVNKTKEMLIDFRRKPTTMTPLTIKGKDIEKCETYKYLGLTISNDLTWNKNIELSRKKAMKKLYFLRTLKKFRLSTKVLESFYNAAILSSLTFGSVVWGGALSAVSKKSINRIHETSARIIGKPQKSLTAIHHERTVKFARKILKDNSHPLSIAFHLLPSQRRYQLPRSRTNRLKNSFIPCAIRFLNCQ